MSWNLSPQALFDAGATSSLWHVAQLVLGALIEAIVPPITLTMLKQASAKLHTRLANHRRKRKQAVNYPWVRGHWADALNSRGFSTGYKRRIPGVCLCGGGGFDRVRDREDLLRR